MEIKIPIVIDDKALEEVLDKLVAELKQDGDFVLVTRCKDCKFSSVPKSASRYELYCNNYDVCFCEKEQKIVCGTHFCSYAELKEIEGE